MRPNIFPQETKGHEMSPGDSECEHDQNICEFVDDMVRYVLENQNWEFPPVFQYGAAFTDKIGKAILRLVQAPNNPDLEIYLRIIVRNCESPSRLYHKQLISRITPVLYEYGKDLDILYPQRYYQFFQVVCRLCQKFQKTRRGECIRVITDYTKRILDERMTCNDTFLALDLHAEAVLLAFMYMRQ